MADESRAKDAPLSLEQIAQLLPGTGEIMASVGEAWWRCADDLGEFERQLVAPLLSALDTRDGPTFERLYASATDRANELHHKWAKPYIKWVLPDEPPKDLELGPVEETGRG